MAVVKHATLIEKIKVIRNELAKRQNDGHILCELWYEILRCIGYTRILFETLSNITFALSYPYFRSVYALFRIKETSFVYQDKRGFFCFMG